MLFLIPIILSFISAITLFGLARRSGFGYLWLVAGCGALIAWLAALAAWLLVPFDPEIASWPVAGLLEPGLVVHWDLASATTMLALASFFLAVILTDVQRAPLLDWRSWGGSLLLSTIVFAGLLAGTLFSLIIFMGAVDLLILALQVTLFREKIGLDLVIKGFIGRGAGIILLFGAAILQSIGGESLISLGIFLLAFYLRLGIFPRRWATIDDPDVNRSFGSALRLAPASLAFILLLRTETLSLTPSSLSWILILLLIPVGLAAFGWIRSDDEILGRSLYLVASASIAVVASLVGDPPAGLFWSLAVYLSGGILFLFQTRRSWFLVLPLLGFWGLSGLPLSATWRSMELYVPLVPPALAAYFLLQGGVLAGYLLHTLRVEETEREFERWELVIYPIGLLLLPLVNLALVWLPWNGMSAIQGLPWWPGFIASALGAAFWWLSQRGIPKGVGPLPIPGRLIRWTSVGLHGVFNWMGRIAGFISFLLEGEGGVLWAILFLALIVTILVQFGLRTFGNGS